MKNGKKKHLGKVEKAEIKTITSLSEEKLKLVKIAVQLIKEGKVIVCPTDTVYGLISDATNEKAVRRVFKIKKRALKKPIPVFVENIRMARSLVYIRKNQEEFLKKVWPGKITVILRAKKKFPKGIVSSDKKIGLRIPNYKLLNILLKKLKRPLTATSANISERPASIKIKKIVNQFKERKLEPDLIIDVGNLKYSKPSTVVDLTKPKLKILRKGAIEEAKLIKIFP